MVQNSFLFTIGCGRFLSCIFPPAPLVLSDSLSDYPLNTLLALILEYSLHSLESNQVGDSGATALADALRVNQSLKTLE